VYGIYSKIARVFKLFQELDDDFDERIKFSM
jgi:hypothetical protein